MGIHALVCHRQIHILQPHFDRHRNRLAVHNFQPVIEPVIVGCREAQPFLLRSVVFSIPPRGKVLTKLK